MRKKYFVLISVLSLSPWLFASAHRTTIVVFSLILTFFAILELLKGVTRRGWNKWLLKNYNFLRSRKTLKIIFLLQLCIIIHIICSIMNSAAEYNSELSSFINHNKYLTWLPHTYSTSASYLELIRVVSLVILFWLTITWILNGYLKYGNLDFLYHFFYFLSINCLLLSLVGFCHYLWPSEKFLWLFERVYAGSETQGIGPFGYRGNFCSYVNLLLPLNFCVFNWLLRRSNTSRKSNAFDGILVVIRVFYLFIIPAVAVCIAGSRSGLICALITMIIGTLITFNIQKFNRSYYLVFMLLIGLFVTVGLNTNFLSILRFTNYNPNINFSSVAPVKIQTVIYDFRFKSTEIPINVTLLNLTLFEFKHSSRFKIQLWIDNQGIITSETQDANANVKLKKFSTSVSDLNKPSIKITFSRLPKIEILENGDSIAIINIDYTFDGVKLNNGFFGALKNQKETNVQIQPLALTTIETNGKKVIWNLNSGIYRFIQSTFSGREIIYRTAFNIIKEKPYVGYGPGVWSEIYSIHKPVGNIVEGFAHLDLIQYIVGYGFPITIISFLILCIVTTTAILKVEYNKLKEVCYLIGIGLIIAILHSFVDYPLQVYSIQLLFVFLLANLMSISELDKQKAKVI